MPLTAEHWPLPCLELFVYKNQPYLPCIANQNKEDKNGMYSIPFRHAGSQRLQQALRIVNKNFLLVGMTENIPDFMEALELLLPHFFTGARDIFKKYGRPCNYVKFVR